MTRTMKVIGGTFMTNSKKMKMMTEYVMDQIHTFFMKIQIMKWMGVKLDERNLYGKNLYEKNLYEKNLYEKNLKKDHLGKSENLFNLKVKYSIQGVPGEKRV